jgi:hydrogenase-4 component F
MILLALLLTPLAGAGVLTVVHGRAGRALHGLTAGCTLAAALGVALAVAQHETVTALDGLLRADALSAWMITIVGLVAALGSAEAPRQVPPDQARRFYPLLHLFVFTMLLALATDELGLMWVAVEGTTLASVFLVGLERTRASLEASYKYLLICSVGIAIAFLGTVLVYFADVQQFGDEVHALRWTTLVRLAPALPARVVELAFIFLLIGYGTKAGLAPMHTWLPDAHSEAPAPVSALMSGVLLSVGLYAILRFKPVVDLAAGPDFAQRLLLALGLLSLGVAAAFLWAPRNYKRMLAYSSVEHLGLVCLGLGFGGAWGTVGAVLHIANHALAKSVLFLLAGRIRLAYGTADIAAVRGLARSMPVTGRGFLLALLALLGLPPFGLFVSELMILGAGIQAGYAGLTALAFGLLVIAFAGILRAAHRMLYTAGRADLPAEPTGWAAMAPIGAALALLVVSGLAWPPALVVALERVRAVVSP